MVELEKIVAVEQFAVFVAVCEIRWRGNFQYPIKSPYLVKDTATICTDGYRGAGHGGDFIACLEKKIINVCSLQGVRESKTCDATTRDDDAKGFLVRNHGRCAEGSVERNREGGWMYNNLVSRKTRSQFPYLNGSRGDIDRSDGTKIYKS